MKLSKLLRLNLISIVKLIEILWREPLAPIAAMRYYFSMLSSPSVLAILRCPKPSGAATSWADR
jgi:hypothetical protein